MSNGLKNYIHLLSSHRGKSYKSQGAQKSLIFFSARIVDTRTCRYIGCRCKKTRKNEQKIIGRGKTYTSHKSCTMGSYGALFGLLTLPSQPTGIPFIKYPEINHGFNDFFQTPFSLQILRKAQRKGEMNYE